MTLAENNFITLVENSSFVCEKGVTDPSSYMLDCYQSQGRW